MGNARADPELELGFGITEIKGLKLCVLAPQHCSEKMPQLNGGGGDDLGANDEMISFKDEGEQEEKISENSSAERDLADVKSSLVNESETNQNSSSDSEVSDKTPRITCPLVWMHFGVKRETFLGAAPRRAAPLISEANRCAIVLCVKRSPCRCTGRRKDGLRLEPKVSETKQEKV